MNCLFPFPVRNKLGFANYVPCGRCMPCRINKTQSWLVRLELEKMIHNKTSFVTLTYDDEHLPKDKGLHKLDLQLFFKRLRKHGLKFKYYAVGEYGEKEQKYFNDDDKILVEKGLVRPHGRPHYHILFFGVDFKNDEYFKILCDCWNNCSTDYFIIHREKLIGSLERASINYVCDYMQKKQYGVNSQVEYWNIQAPFSLSSQQLGISAFSDNKENYIKNGFIKYNGKNVPIPRYFRNKFDIPTIFNIPDNNFYKCLCLEKKLIKSEDIPYFDNESRKRHTNMYFHICHEHFSGRFEEMEKLLKKRNFLYSRNKI